MNSPARPRPRTIAGRISRVDGEYSRAFFFAVSAGVSSATAGLSASATAAPPLRRVPIMTAPSGCADGGGGSCLDVGQVPPLDAGVEHRHRHHQDGAEVLESRSRPAGDAGTDDALGQADEEAAPEGDAERLEPAEDRAGEGPDTHEEDQVRVERHPGAHQD